MKWDESLELFPEEGRSHAPLAERIRPQKLDEILGQDALLDRKGPLRVLVERGEVPSLILWGPPGTGKTTLARLLAESAHKQWIAYSAVNVGVKEIRAAIEEARQARQRGKSTALFLDEIHRFNKSQQDVLLPHVESGVITLIGATTENPSFEVNNALLSRCRVYILAPLTREALEAIVRRALADCERGLGALGLEISDDAVAMLCAAADGDARRALGFLESTAALNRSQTPETKIIDTDTVEQAIGEARLRYDRAGEEHYNLASALIKSMRASDPDAAIYYLARMIEGGEDPLFIARRLVIFAAEDIGNAEPGALSLATSTYLALERIGMPEGRIPLAQAVVFLACAPKSNASYAAVEAALSAARSEGSLPVPKHLCNAPTRLMKELGYHKGYRYPHNDPSLNYAGPDNLPKDLSQKRFYQAGSVGWEARAEERRKRTQGTPRTPNDPKNAKQKE